MLVVRCLHLAVFLCLPGLLFGQATFSSITGIVTDSSNLAVPGAEVVVTNLDTGVVRQSSTNSAGTYAFVSLIPGPYRVEVRMKGFRPKELARAELRTGQEMRLDFAIEVGPVTETVDVIASSEAVSLQRESAEISDVLIATEIRSLPLGNRDPYSLLDLAAGVTAAGDDPSGLGYAGGTTTVNGSRAGGTSFNVDGASTSHHTGMAESVGSVEAIQEFKVQSHTYSAEFGRSSGGVVTFQVKSGTKDLHGTAYGHFRDTAINANNWANNQRGLPLGENSSRTYGGTLGGPMPGMHQKLFYFASYEGFQDHTPDLLTRTVPDAAMRAGDFSRLSSIVKDPLSSAPFPGNALPSSRLDQAAVKMLKLLPGPNDPGSVDSGSGVYTSNFVRPVSNLWYSNYGILRLDYNPAPRHKLFMTFSHINEGTEPGPDFSGPLNSVTGPFYRHLRRLTVNYTRFFGSSLTHEVVAYAQRDPYHLAPLTPDFDVTSQLGIQRKIGATFPRVTISGGFSAWGNGNNAQRINQPAGLSDATTWLKGHHTLRFGAQLYQNQYYWYGNSNADSGGGSYTFNGEITGLGRDGLGNPVNAMADFLLGQVKTANARLIQVPATRMNYNLGIYLNDNYKVTRCLTLNLGLRYEFETRIVVKNNVFSRADLTTGQLLVAGRNASRNLNMQNNYNNWAPRIGLAYSLDDKTVLRSGVAVFQWSFWTDNGGQVNYPGWTNSQSFADQGVGKPQPFTLSQGFPIETVSGVPDPLALFAAASPARPLTHESVSYSQSAGLPRSLQWNFGLQRTLPAGLFLDVAYIASLGDRLSRTIAANNPTLDRAPEVVIQRVAIQQVRPLPRFSAFNAVYYDGRSSYNSLQIKAKRHVRGSVDLTASFTWQKNMDTFSNHQDSAQIPWQFPDLERSVSSLDRTRMFTLGWVWELPAGRNRHFLNSGWGSRLLGGFQLNGILKAADGLPMTIRQNNTNTILSAQRPDVIDPAHLNGLAGGASFIGYSRIWLIQTSDPAFPFVRSSNVGIGNLGRNTSRGPGYFNVNLSLFRAFRLGEKVTLQFRAEGYNALNHVNYLKPASQDLSNANYGRITASSPARRLVLGLRLSF